MVNITYSEIVDLINNNQLIVGEQYKITDYVDACGNSVINWYIIATAKTTSKLYSYVELVDKNGVYVDNIDAIYQIENDNGVKFEWCENNQSQTGVIYYLSDTNENDGWIDFYNYKNENDDYVLNYTNSTNAHLPKIYKNGKYYVPKYQIENSNDIYIEEFENIEIDSNLIVNSENINISANNHNIQISNSENVAIGENNNDIQISNSTNLVVNSENQNIQIENSNNNSVIDSNTSVSISNSDNNIVNNSTDINVDSANQNKIENSNNISVDSGSNNNIITDSNGVNLADNTAYNTITNSTNIDVDENTLSVTTNESNNIEINNQTENVEIDNINNTIIDGDFIELFSNVTTNENGENIVTNTNGTTKILNDDGSISPDENSFLTDSPIDGNTYGRRNGNWEQIQGAEYTGGNNIDITNNVITAKGYNVDSQNNITTDSNLNTNNLYAQNIAVDEDVEIDGTFISTATNITALSIQNGDAIIKNINCTNKLTCAGNKYPAITSQNGTSLEIAGGDTDSAGWIFQSDGTLRPDSNNINPNLGLSTRTIGNGYINSVHSNVVYANGANSGVEGAIVVANGDKIIASASNYLGFGSVNGGARTYFSMYQDPNNQQGYFMPTTNEKMDLGYSGYNFRNGYINYVRTNQIIPSRLSDIQLRNTGWHRIISNIPQASCGIFMICRSYNTKQSESYMFNFCCGYGSAGASLTQASGFFYDNNSHLITQVRIGSISGNYGYFNIDVYISANNAESFYINYTIGDGYVDFLDTPTPTPTTSKTITTTKM